MASVRESLPIDMEEDEAAKNEKKINREVSAFDSSRSDQATCS
jgi:hypothetical protein